MSAVTKRNAKMINEDLASVDRTLKLIKSDVDALKDKELSSKLDGCVKAVNDTREHISKRLNENAQR